MKKLSLILVLILALAACKNEDKKVEDIATETTEVTVETPFLAIAEFDTKAGDFVSKEIKIKGQNKHELFLFQF